MARIGYVTSLWLLVGFCAVFVPVGTFGMDRCVGESKTSRQMDRLHACMQVETADERTCRQKNRQRDGETGRQHDGQTD